MYTKTLIENNFSQNFENTLKRMRKTNMHIFF